MLLNLLIAIVGDTYDKVTEKKEASKLREMCEMIADYEVMVNRDNEFKVSKYIIVLRVEKAASNSNLDWEGRIATLKTHIHSTS